MAILLRGLALLLLILTLVAQGSPCPPANAADYRLATGDQLRIKVFDNEDISGEYGIDAAGNVNFPLVGQVKAAGLTVDAFTADLTRRLDADYLVNPKVSVEVLNFRPIFVIGQVNSPGSYAYSPGMTVRQAVALAGGYTRRASTSGMTIIRQDGGGTVELEAEEDTEVLPGDTIEVDRRFL